MHFRFCFSLFSSRCFRLKLDSGDFIDSLAGYGIQCAFKYFSRKIFSASGSEILFAARVERMKERLFTILLFLRYVSCLSSGELFLMFAFLCNALKTYFSPVYAQSANVQFKTTARMLLDIDSRCLHFYRILCVNSVEKV